MIRRVSIVLLVCLLTFPVLAQQDYDTGNVIFFHPDGSGLTHWQTGRIYWYGPDSPLNWDLLPEMAIYRGHIEGRLTATSNAGATTHGFGYKSDDDAFGQDEDRPINSLSGYPGSILREAAAAGMPVGLVNDGHMAEPGTAAFAAEVEDRDEEAEIVRQLLDGRPGFEGEARPVVMLAGGEAWFLPEETPRCEDEITLDCYVHENPLGGDDPEREDGRNLLREFAAAGYEIIRTHAELDALWDRLDADPAYTPRVLGLFAYEDLYNAVTEESLIDRGLVDDSMAGTRQGRLILWGSLPDTPGYNPPTPAEMNRLALEILSRHSRETGTPFLLISEVESTDNFSNNTNAIGMLNAIKRADDSIAVFRSFITENPDTLLLVTADSAAGAPQVLSPPRLDDDDNVTTTQGNSTEVNDEPDFDLPLDGIEGQSTAPFVSAPDLLGDTHQFAISWAGVSDFAGAVVSRAEGLNSDLLRTYFRGQLDNTDVYRIMYTTLFGRMLPASYGQEAPDRTP